jgi:hypothetical protein
MHKIPRAWRECSPSASPWTRFLAALGDPPAPPGALDHVLSP